jgi:hypothetical protein
MMTWKKERFKKYIDSTQLHPIDKEVIQKVYFERGDAYSELVAAIKKQIIHSVPNSIRKYLREEGSEMLRLHPKK